MRRSASWLSITIDRVGSSSFFSVRTVSRENRSLYGHRPRGCFLARLGYMENVTSCCFFGNLVLWESGKNGQNSCQRQMVPTLCTAERVKMWLIALTIATKGFTGVLIANFQRKLSSITDGGHAHPTITYCWALRPRSVINCMLMALWWGSWTIRHWRCFERYGGWQWVNRIWVGRIGGGRIRGGLNKKKKKQRKKNWK